jgi:hypothetical protein
MSLVTRQGKGSKLTIQEMDGNLTYLESLTQSGFKKITIPLGIQSGGTVEINTVEYFYFTSNEENLFFGQGIVDFSESNVFDNDFSFYEDSDGLIHIGSIVNALASQA